MKDCTEPAVAPAGPDAGAPQDASLLSLEREKIEIERERLALERDRLAAEREKWRADAAWKQRAEGRVGLSPFLFLVTVAGFFALGIVLGAFLPGRGGAAPDSLDRRRMTHMILDAMHTTTNRTEHAQGLFLLRALASPDVPPGGGARVMIE